MTSATLSKWVVFKGAVKRLKWLGILYLAVLTLEVPLPLWVMLTQKKTFQGASWVAAKSIQYTDLFNPISLLTNLVMAVIMGMLLFHYLQNERGNTFFHSLPIKRTTLYWQNLLAGVTFLWVPLLITAIFTGLVISGFGITQLEWQTGFRSIGGNYVVEGSTVLTPILGILAFWIFYHFLYTGLFLVTTVGAGMLTGSAILQGALTIIGLFLPMGLYVLLKGNLARLLYGFSENMGVSTEWYSPLVSYLSDSNWRTLFLDIRYGAYLAAAVVMIGLSVYLYKHRKAEAAGENLAADWIRWVFKYGVTVCAALAGGLYFASYNDHSLAVLYLGYGLGALLGYVIAPQRIKV